MLRLRIDTPPIMALRQLEQSQTETYTDSYLTIKATEATDIISDSSYQGLTDLHPQELSATKGLNPYAWGSTFLGAGDYAKLDARGQ